MTVNQNKNHDATRWGGAEMQAFLEQAKRSQVGGLAYQWVELENELTRLRKRLPEISGDRIMENMITTRLQEGEAILRKKGRALVEAQSQNAADIVCKMAISRRLDCADGRRGSDAYKLSDSALGDMIRFLKTRNRISPPKV